MNYFKNIFLFLLISIFLTSCISSNEVKQKDDLWNIVEIKNEWKDLNNKNSIIGLDPIKNSNLETIEIQRN